MVVGFQHRGVAVAGEKFDHAILVGLETGRLAERIAELRVLARRHGAQHVPGAVELLEDPRHPRQHLE